MPANIITIIQARMASSRLPGKVLLDIAGRPMLAWVVERARRSKMVDRVVVATTTDPADDEVEAFCRASGYAITRGSLQDVLDRYYQAARAFSAGIVVRLTADCPLIDPGLIDETVQALYGLPLGAGQAGDSRSRAALPAPVELCDFAADRLPPPWGRTYPIGLDVEVCTFAALERAWREAGQPYQREHVMPYLYENEPVIDARSGRQIAPGLDSTRRRGFQVRLLNHEPDYGSLRWTVDTPEDLELVRQIFARFPGREDFSWLEVLALFEREPELADLNAAVRHKNFQEVDVRGQEQAR
jgi:spore coat polysaccharide biosynthesis protein SpsF